MAKTKEVFPFELRVSSSVYGGGHGIEYIDTTNGYGTHCVCRFRTDYYDPDKCYIEYTQKASLYAFTWEQSFLILSVFNKRVDVVKKRKEMREKASGASMITPAPEVVTVEMLEAAKEALLSGDSY